MLSKSNPSGAAPLSIRERGLRLLRPSHQHSAYSATLLLMSAVMASRILAYGREAYIAYAFGAGAQTDAYVAAFTLPDWLNYIVAGGATSITFITIYTRFLAEKREEEAAKTYSVILTVMTTVLVVGTALAEVFTPQFVGWMFGGFTPQQVELCAHLTRILLPAQIFFYAGGIFAAVLLSHRMFLFPAIGPLLMNGCVIGGGLLGARHWGISSLAYGSVAGAFLGPLLINAIAARRVGPAYRISFDIKNPGFREWVGLSLPLMLGVSLVSADDWILRYFASGSVGDIARLNYAKRLLMVPIGVLGLATGQASMPFFARLFGEKRMQEFAATVNESVYRVTAVSLLAAAWMMAASLPLIDLVYRRGHFLFSDSRETANYFFLFSISLAFWSAQAIYARAFYSAGDTLTPMVAVTMITAASLAVYSALFHQFSVAGLAAASDIGIAANAFALAILLGRKRLVPLRGFPWSEFARVLLTAALAFMLSREVARVVPVDGSRKADFLALGLISVTWAGGVAGGLWLLRSNLLRDLRDRRLPAKG